MSRFLQELSVGGVATAAVALFWALAVRKGLVVMGGWLPLNPVEVDGVSSPISILLLFGADASVGFNHSATLSWPFILGRFTGPSGVT